MENQPTVILLLFTDYLSNRDSIAFFRLNRSFWFSHRSSAGRYRLKPPDYGPLLRPSRIPQRFIDFPLSSPSSGHFLLSSLHLSRLSDFSLFLPSTRAGTGEIPLFFQGVKEISFNLELLEKPRIEEDDEDTEEKNGEEEEEEYYHHEIPPQLVSTRLESFSFQHGEYYHPFPFKRLKEFLPTGVKKLDFYRCHEIQSEGFDFSCFPQLEELTMWQQLNSSVIFPPSLRILDMSSEFNSVIEEKALPESLEELRFPISYSAFNRPLPAKLPKNLRLLELGRLFDQTIWPGQLPETLEILKIAGVYNIPLQPGCLPSGLKEFNFQSSSFNHPLLPGLFPNSLKRFIFLCNVYSQPFLPDLLPNSLASITIVIAWDRLKCLPTLPLGLKTLNLMDSFNRPLCKFPNFLAVQLRELNLGVGFNKPLEAGIFPSSLETIDLGFSFVQRLPEGIFPIGLKKVSFGPDYNEPLPVGLFPPSIEEICFGPGPSSKFNQPLSLGVFPNGIKKIRFSHSFDQILPVGIFPPGIEIILFGERYSHPLEVGLFPASVRNLEISTAHPLPLGLFPEGLESIEFNSAFNQLLLPGIFPSSLRRLSFYYPGDYKCYSHDFLPGVLPEFLCELDLGVRLFFGLFPSSALPPYFLPDPSDSLASPHPHRLKFPADCSESSYDFLDDLMIRIGRDRLFHLKIPRAPISSDALSSFNVEDLEYFIACPVDGIGDSFLLSKELLEIASED